MTRLRRHADFAIASWCTAPKNAPEIATVLLGTGETAATGSEEALRRTLSYLRILPFEKLILVDSPKSTLTFITPLTSTAIDSYSLIPNDRVVFKKRQRDCQQLITLGGLGYIDTPDASAIAGTRMNLIAVIEKMLSYADHFHSAEEKNTIYCDQNPSFRLIAPYARSQGTQEVRKSQFLSELLFLDYYRRHNAQGTLKKLLQKKTEETPNVTGANGVCNTHTVIPEWKDPFASGGWDAPAIEINDAPFTIAVAEKVEKVTTAAKVVVKKTGCTGCGGASTNQSSKKLTDSGRGSLAYSGIQRVPSGVKIYGRQ